jgi:hypothetical protein
MKNEKDQNALNLCDVGYSIHDEMELIMRQNAVLKAAVKKSLNWILCLTDGDVSSSDSFVKIAEIASIDVNSLNSHE